MDSQKLLEDLVGKNLSTFKIEIRTEVYRVDDNGLNPQPIGVFKNKTIAEAFAGQAKDSSCVKTEQIFVLTDGETFLKLNKVSEVTTFFDDEDQAQKIKENALNKLNAAERKLLGFIQ